MALSDVSIGDFMPHGSLTTDLDGLGDTGSVNTGFHRFTDVGADSGMTDVNTTAMSPYNPFFGERRTDRPAYDSATDPFRAQMKQAARVGDGVAYTQAQDAVRRVDDVYGLVHGEMGVNDRETMDAFRYGQRRVAGRNLVGVESEIAKMQAKYIAEQAIRRGRHVRDLEGEEAQLDAQFDFGFDQAFDRAGSTGRLSPETQTAMASYKSNPAEREMRKLSAKRALQEIEKADNVLYTAAVRGAALQKFCEYYAMSKAFGAFGNLDDQHIMREAVNTTLAAGAGKSDQSMFARFNEACARYADGFFTYSDSPTADIALGMQVRDRNGNTVQTGFIPVLRQVFEQQAAEDLVNGKQIGSNTSALSEKLVKRLQDKYGFAQGATDKDVAADVWKRVADNIVQQSANGHVDCSKLATLYVQDQVPPTPQEFKTVSEKLYNTLETMSGTLLDEYIGGRPAYYGKWYWPFGESDAAQRDRFMGEEMRKGVNATVDDSLASLGPTFLGKNKALIEGYKAEMANLIEYANKYGDPNAASADEYKNTAHAITTALTLAANLATISDGKFKPSQYMFGKVQNKRWYVGDQDEWGNASWGDDRYRGRTHSFENAFATLRGDLQRFLKENSYDHADQKMKTVLTVAKSYLAAIDRFGEATGDPSKVGAERRATARDAVAALFGGINPFEAQSQMGTAKGADGNLRRVSLNPYDIVAVADSEAARQAAYAGLAGMVTGDDITKQQMLNRFIQAAYSDKLNPVDAGRIAAVTEQLLSESCSGMAKNAEMMENARRELTPAVALAMRDAGHFVLQGVADGDVEVDDPEHPGEKIRAVKAFVPTANVWEDDRAVEILRKKLRPTLGRLQKRSENYAAAELAQIENKRIATANVQLATKQAQENDMTRIPANAMYRNR